MQTRTMVLIGILTAGACLAADPLPDTVEAYKAQYETLKGKLDAKRDKVVGDAIELYRQELATLLANVRQQGDLDYVVAIQNELTRTATDRHAPTEPADKRMKHLRHIQWAARQTEDKATEAHDKDAAKLREAYLGSLKALEKRLVAANQIEEAKKARDEREGMETAIEIVSGPPCEIVEYRSGDKVYPDMRRLWGAVPRELVGYEIARCPLRSAGKWVVRPTLGRYVHALVPEGMADHFSDWQLVRKVDAAFGDEYRFVWLVMRKEAQGGTVTFPGDVPEAAFPFGSKISRR